MQNSAHKDLMVSVSDIDLLRVMLLDVLGSYGYEGCECPWCKSKNNWGCDDRKDLMLHQQDCLVVKLCPDAKVIDKNRTSTR